MKCMMHVCFQSVFVLRPLQWLLRNREDSLWKPALQLLRNLCRDSGCLPSALFVSGVEFDSGRDPIACGAYTDVYRGFYNKDDVAVKRVRIAGGPTDREIFSKVCVRRYVHGALFVLTLLSDLSPKP
jgi:hypothetical protein